MDVFCQFRDAVKNNAKAEDAAKILFKLSDEIRDDVLPKLGIQIEDKGVEASVWKMDDPAKLMERRNKVHEEKKKKELEK
jgi:cysteinyl-tRNA synthetase